MLLLSSAGDDFGGGGDAIKQSISLRITIGDANLMCASNAARVDRLKTRLKPTMNEQVMAFASKHEGTTTMTFLHFAFSRLVMRMLLLLLLIEGEGNNGSGGISSLDNDDVAE